MGVLNRLRQWATGALVALVSAVALAAGPSEYEVKAVFLFNFTQFVDWPPEAFESPDAELVIGVLGDDPFGVALDSTVEGEVISGRTLTVRRYAEPSEVERCHILYIGMSNPQRLREVLSQLRDRPVLTVGDAPEFARLGGVVQFVMIDSKIKLQINLDAARLANLTLSSKLLKPARIVSTSQP